MRHRHCFVALLLPAPLFAGAPPTPIQEGLWEVTTQTEVIGTTAPSAPTLTRTCLSRQDVEAHDAVPLKNDKCDASDYRQNGNRATWTIECGGKERLIGSGNVTFISRQEYSGSAQLTLQAPGASPLHMTHRYSGRRIGNCEKQ